MHLGTKQSGFARADENFYFDCFGSQETSEIKESLLDLRKNIPLFQKNVKTPKLILSTRDIYIYYYPTSYTGSLIL